MKTSALLAGSFVAVFFVLQGWLIHGADDAIANYAEPVVAASTHSFLYPETRPSAALDNNAETFWADMGLFAPDSRRPPVLRPYEGLYLLFSAGMTHKPGRIPAPFVPSDLAVKSGAPGAAFREYSRPRRIRISYFEQQLFQINHDYRFPDPPLFIASKDVLLVDTAGEQRLRLDFLPVPGPSTGFPDQIKERWFRLEILDSYPGSSHREVAISEIRLIQTGR